MSIQLFIPKFRTEECLVQIRECLDKGWTGLGFKTIEMENAWNKFTGHKFSHFLNSNTSGLHLALYVLKKKYNWNDDDEVISTPLTFVSTNHAIRYVNLKPVFADVDQYLCLDPESIRERITPKTRAVMYVGLGGNTGQYQKILDLCKEKGLKLILDAAHMAGTQFKGKHVGPEADVSVYSFQAVKNLPTADSGMICFQNADEDELVRKLSWLGINKDTFTRIGSQGNYKWLYDVEDVGFKYHGNSIMAAIGLVQLKYLNDDNSHRAKIAQVYRENLGSSPHLQMVPIHPDCHSSFHLCQIRTKHRDMVLVRLNEAGVFPGVHYRDNTEYRMYAYGKGTCPRADLASREIISLPLHVGLSEGDALTVCNEVIKAVTAM